MSEHCKYEELVLGFKKDLYNDGQGIKYKVNVLWENYYKDMGKRDVLLTVNTIVVLLVGGLTILDKLGVI